MTLDPTEKGAYYHEDVSHVARLASLAGRRLSFPVEVMSGEGFPELLFRAASENGYQTSNFVLQLLGMKKVFNPTPAAMAGRPLDCKLVADILGLPSYESATSLLHEYTDSAGTTVNFFGRNVRKANFFEHHRRVSPRFLRQSNYQKAIWSIQGITFDPTTREQLLSTCPVCGSFFSFRDTFGVEQCATCYQRDGVVTDLREHSCALIDVEDGEALDLAVELVNPEVSVSDIEWRLFHEDLRRFGPGHLFELISSLAYYKNQLTHDRGRRAAPVERLRLPHAHDLAEAARAVIGWPSGFEAYAEKMRALQLQRLQRSPIRSAADPGHPVSLASRILEKDLRTMVSTIATSARGEVAFKAILGSAATADRRSTVADLAQAFGSSYRSNAKIAALRTEKERGTGVTPSAVNFLVVSSSVKFRRFSRRTRLPLCFISDLINSNLLEEIDPVCEDFLGRRSAPPGIGIEARLETVASKGQIPWSAMPLYVAVSALTRTDLNPWPTVLSAILNFELRVWRHPKTTAPTHYLVADFHKLRSLLSEAVTPSIGHLPVGEDSVRYVLGLTREGAAWLKRQKILKDDLTLSDLWAFHDLHISSEEITTRLGMTGCQSDLSSIISQLRERNISCIGSYGGRWNVAFWPRSHVESLSGARLAPRAISAPRELESNLPHEANRTRRRYSNKSMT
ncbi:hypothetical protein ELI15_17115 [Rhizobium ruizarguesonis]|uniref:hypothetical protein n=1 Tax=Rhizobium ruizarguesonis TaxID=2081791 RepID=UPI0010321118|nr:hypothetical protein [Rhizobium ruizarguesonis]TAW65982.1 hypothetical protein ELI15_17115 [Rhizobium ruizarguesonis]